MKVKVIVNPSSISIEKLRSRPGKRIVFVTNNSTKSRADYKEKLESMGIAAETVRLKLYSCSKEWYCDRLLGQFLLNPITVIPIPTPNKNSPCYRKKSSAPPTVPPFTSPVSCPSHPIKTPSSSLANPALKPNFAPKTSPSLAALIPHSTGPPNQKTTAPSLPARLSTLPWASFSVALTSTSTILSSCTRFTTFSVVLCSWLLT